MFFGLLRFSGSGQDRGQSGNATSHLSMLVFILVASWGWGFYLDHYELALLHSGRGLRSRLYGGSCDEDRLLDHGRRLGGGAVRCWCSISSGRDSERSLVGSGIYVALYFIAILLLPALFQKFLVQPNELARETPYLKNNIEFTRKAYSSTRSRKHPIRRWRT